MTLTIRDVQPATPRARVVRVDLDGHAFGYVAGQAVMVGTHGGDDRRAYSIASAPEDAKQLGCFELLVGLNDDGTPGPHLSLTAGALVDVEGPLGTFTFPEAPSERHFVFVAGGTGIAPLRAMLRHAILGSVAAERIGLLYSARTPDDFAFADEFRALASSGVIEFRQTITRDAQDWSGARGRIDRAALAALVHDPDTLCFVCGPAAMVADMPRLLGEIGVSRERIKIEEW